MSKADEMISSASYRSGPNVDTFTEDSCRPKISIIVLNWNSYHITRDCLNSLRMLDYPNYEIVLVDNGSTDGSADKLAKEFPEARLIRNSMNLGFSGGNNIAIENILKSGTDYILLLNNDTVVAPNLLSELVNAARNRPQAGLLNPKILYHDAPERIWYAGGQYKLGQSFATHFGMGKLDNGRYNELKEVSFVTGCALLMRAQAVKQVGPLDEIFFFGLEDLDWCMRARSAGFEAVYVPSAVVWHKESYVTKKNLGKPVKDFYYVRNSILLARKHFRFWHWPIFFLSMAQHIGYRTLGYLIRLEPARIQALYAGIRSGCKTKVLPLGKREPCCSESRNP